MISAINLYSTLLRTRLLSPREKGLSSVGILHIDHKPILTRLKRGDKGLISTLALECHNEMMQEERARISVNRCDGGHNTTDANKKIEITRNILTAFVKMF